MWTWLKKQMKPSNTDHARTLKAWPELAQLSDPDERRKVLAIAVGIVHPGFRIWFYVLFPVMLVGFLIGLAMMGAALRGTAWGWVLDKSQPGVTVVSLMLTGALIMRLRRRRFERAIREELVRRGCAVCVSCGYDLRGQTEARCPECGVLFNPDILEANGSGAINGAGTAGSQQADDSPAASRVSSRRLKQYPDLALFDANQRDHAWSLAKSGAGGWLVAAFLGVCLGAVIICLATDWYLVPRLGPKAKPWDFRLMMPTVLTPYFALICFRIAGSFRRKHIERSLRRQLVERGHVICIRCGYDLKGQVDSRCPGCDAEFDPELLTAPPPLRDRQCVTQGSPDSKM